MSALGGFAALLKKLSIDIQATQGTGPFAQTGPLGEGGQASVESQRAQGIGVAAPAGQAEASLRGPRQPGRAGRALGQEQRSRRRRLQRGGGGRAAQILTAGNLGLPEIGARTLGGR